MQIAFDAKRIFQNYTGLGNYSRTLVKNLLTFFPEEKYHLFAPKIKENETTKFFLENQNLSLHLPQHSFRAYWRTHGMVNDLKKSGCTLFHGLSHEIPIGIQHSKIKSIVTMHDLIFKVYPDYYPTAQRWIYDWKFRYACENSDIIIAISEQTKQDILTYYNIPSEKIKVIYQTCGNRFQEPILQENIEKVRQKYNLPNEYMLYVGSVIDRKNLLRIVQAMKQLPSDLDIPLVVVGEGAAYFNKVQDFVKKNGLTNRVIFISSIVYAQLPEIYAGATLFLYPSEYEGFGIPVIEALFTKVPVITSNCSCLPEAGGKDSLLVNPTSVEEIADAIQKVLEDSTLQEKMIKNGYDYAVKNFSAEKVTKELFELYQETSK